MNITDVDDGESELCQHEYPFLGGHLGFEFSYLQKHKHDVILVISLHKGALCRIKNLDMSLNDISSITADNIELYAETAMTVF